MSRKKPINRAYYRILSLNSLEKAVGHEYSVSTLLAGWLYLARMMLDREDFEWWRKWCINSWPRERCKALVILATLIAQRKCPISCKDDVYGHMPQVSFDSVLNGVTSYPEFDIPRYAFGYIKFAIKLRIQWEKASVRSFRISRGNIAEEDYY